MQFSQLLTLPIVTSVVLLVAVGTVLYGSSAPIHQDNDSYQQNSSVTRSGLFICLPLQSAQTVGLACALGLRADGNKYYALSGLPETAARTPANARIKVTGLYHPKILSDKFSGLGTITVKDFQTQ